MLTWMASNWHSYILMPEVYTGAGFPEYNSLGYFKRLQRVWLTDLGLPLLETYSKVELWGTVTTR